MVRGKKVSTNAGASGGLRAQLAIASSDSPVDALPLSKEKKAEVKRMIAELNKGGRLVLAVSAFVLDLRDRLGLSREQISSLLGCRDQEVDEYARLDRLADPVRPFADRIKPTLLACITFVKPELQLGLAKEVIAGRVNDRSLRARVRLPAFRDPAVPHRARTLKW